MQYTINENKMKKILFTATLIAGLAISALTIQNSNAQEDPSKPETGLTKPPQGQGGGKTTCEVKTKCWLNLSTSPHSTHWVENGFVKCSSKSGNCVKGSNYVTCDGIVYNCN